MAGQQPNADVLRSARELIRRGSPQRAIDLIGSAWEGKDTRPPAAILVLAEAYDAVGQSAEADRILNAAAEALPSNTFIRYRLGVRALRDGAYEAALVISEALLAEGGVEPSRFLLNANALRALGRTGHALDVLSRARAMFGENAELAVLQAQMLMAAGRSEQAFAELHSQISQWRDNFPLLGLFANILVNTGRFEECIAFVTPYLACRNPRCVRLYHWFVRACARVDLFGKILERLPETLAAWPDASVPAIHLSMAAAALGRTDFPSIAAPLSTPALAAAEQDFAELMRYGIEAAERLVRRLIAIDPYAEPLQALAIKVQLVTGDYQTAINYYQTRFNAQTLRFPDAIQYAKILWESDNPQLANNVYLYAIAQATARQKATALLEFGQFLLAIGDLEQAQSRLQTAHLEQVPPELDEKLGWLLRETAKLTGARPPRQSHIRTAHNIDVAHDVLEDGHLTHYRFGDKTCIIWFGGVIPVNLGVFLARTLDFWLSMNISVITITDTKRLACVGGYGRYFPDRSAAEQSLIGHICNFGYQRFATVGTSLSGYSAIIYGCNMRASGTLSFAGPSYIPAPENILDPRGSASLKRLLRSTSLEFLDIKPLLRLNPQFILHQHYGSESAFDTDQAERLSDLPSVRLFGEKHAVHDVIEWLHKYSLLDSRLRQFADEAGLIE